MLTEKMEGDKYTPVWKYRASKNLYELWSDRTFIIQN